MDIHYNRIKQSHNLKIYTSKNWIRLIIGSLLLVVGLCILEHNYGYFNNYLIFTRPLQVILKGANIYDFHPDLYMDTFKYSPGFAIIFGTLFYIPNTAGIIIWNLLNASVLIAGIHRFFNTDKSRIQTLLLLVPMIAISVHNEQSNGLVAGFILIALSYFRAEKSIAAALFLSFCLFIKFYGILLAVSFIFYRRKVLFLLAFVAFTILQFLWPFLFFDTKYMFTVYQNWWHVLQTTGLTDSCTVPGVFKTWFGLYLPNWLWLIAGSLILILPLTNRRMFDKTLYQNLMLSSFMIFMILFNKMAGFPTYLIAVAGFAIFYNSGLPKTRIMKTLALLVLLLGLLSQYRLPYNLVDNLILPSHVWAFLFLIIWSYLQILLWKLEFSETSSNSTLQESNPEIT